MSMQVHTAERSHTHTRTTNAAGNVPTVQLCDECKHGRVVLHDHQQGVAQLQLLTSTTVTVHGLVEVRGGRVQRHAQALRRYVSPRRGPLNNEEEAVAELVVARRGLLAVARVLVQAECLGEQLVGLPLQVVALQHAWGSSQAHTLRQVALRQFLRHTPPHGAMPGATRIYEMHAPVAPPRKIKHPATHFFLDRELYARVQRVTAVSNSAAAPTLGIKAAFTSSLAGAVDLATRLGDAARAALLAASAKSDCVDRSPSNLSMWTMLHISRAAFSLSVAAQPHTA